MKHRSLIAIAAVGTLILAACGDDDDDAADTVAVEATPAGAEVPTATDAAAPPGVGAATIEAASARSHDPVSRRCQRTEDASVSRHALNRQLV